MLKIAEPTVGLGLPVSIGNEVVFPVPVAPVVPVATGQILISYKSEVLLNDGLKNVSY
ncbi:hypothetical protein OWP12_13415 [Bacillus pacificus]|uniref:hypothetical protein n=1 Tax=Bacillus TaxID=1386 RepID=UPI00254BFC19|nr:MULTISPECIES: hypothetical protein [Bacillus]MDK7546472.1 hypothetical protein [Bacillus pacificus]MDK7550510.1 hypothetical protein [Bacillus pacificus]MDK7566056.1 hypothetical protein [Bacillus pacificus]MDK7579289.1 hypothetical protein [Bacillus pacificus]